MNEIICGNSRIELKRYPDNYFDCCVTSPPYYGLRDYGTEPIIVGGNQIVSTNGVQMRKVEKNVFVVLILRSVIIRIQRL